MLFKWRLKIFCMVCPTVTQRIDNRRNVNSMWGWSGCKIKHTYLFQTVRSPSGPKSHPTAWKRSPICNVYSAFGTKFRDVRRETVHWGGYLKYNSMEFRPQSARGASSKVRMMTRNPWDFIYLMAAAPWTRPKYLPLLQEEIWPSTF